LKPVFQFLTEVLPEAGKPHQRSWKLENIYKNNRSWINYPASYSIAVRAATSCIKSLSAAISTSCHSPVI